MRSKKNVETIKLQDGEYLEKEFDNYIDMATNAVDWTYFCSYELKPNSPKGVYKILSLPNMHIAYSDTTGGLMMDLISPKDTITFNVMECVKDKACLSHMKLKTNNLIVIDDTKRYNFMYNDAIKLYEVSLKRDANTELYDKLSSVVDKYFDDSDKKIVRLLESVILKYSNAKKLDLKTSRMIEVEIVEEMLKLFDNQEAKVSHLTKSEKIAFAIREKVFNHMDAHINIESLSKEHGISEKSLQNSFKSLFGFTPKHFLQLMKLNLVRHELVKSSSNDTTVLRTAQKWGFRHMGRFSKYYLELFREKPSATLQKANPFNDGMNIKCVERKEEI